MRTFRRKAVNRRTFVRGASALAGGTLAFPHVRESFAQTPDASPAASPVGAGETVIVSSVEGVPNAYLAYPEPFKTVDEAPGDGSTVKMLTLSYRPPVPGRKKTRIGKSWRSG